MEYEKIESSSPLDNVSRNANDKIIAHGINKDVKFLIKKSQNGLFYMESLLGELICVCAFGLNQDNFILSTNSYTEKKFQFQGFMKSMCLTMVDKLGWKITNQDYLTLQGENLWIGLAKTKRVKILNRKTKKTYSLKTHKHLPGKSPIDPFTNQSEWGFLLESEISQKNRIAKYHLDLKNLFQQNQEVVYLIEYFNVPLVDDVPVNYRVDLWKEIH